MKLRKAQGHCFNDDLKCKYCAEPYKSADHPCPNPRKYQRVDAGIARKIVPIGPHGLSMFEMYG